MGHADRDADLTREPPLQADYFDRPALAVAPELIGAQLRIGPCTGIITETEAYGRDDPASHSFSGPRPRNAAMFGPPGRAYVYRSYGLHWCVNTVCREAGHGAGVLLRALEPTHGIDTMRQRRGVQDVRLLCSGPGRLAQALGIDASFNHLPLDEAPFALLEPEAAHRPAVPVVAGPRIGISKAVDVPWRFGLHGSRYLSRGFGSAAAVL